MGAEAGKAGTRETNKRCMSVVTSEGRCTRAEVRGTRAGGCEALKAAGH